MSETMVGYSEMSSEFGRLLEQHAGIVRKVAASYSRNPHDRADLMQEIVAQLWQAYPRYDQARSFSTWMYRVALNVAISNVRSEQQRRDHVMEFDPENHDIAAESTDHAADQQLAMLQRLIASLDPMNRALMMLYLDDRSHRDISEILGISESNVGTKIGRLKHYIREQLA
jgi:RNA polymerase sigma factor (sigma-70 family)